MSVRTKALVTFLLVGVVIAVLSLQTQNNGLFKGQIKLNEEEAGETAEEPVVDASTLRPDLRPSIEVVPATQPGEDIKVDVTIENLGPGPVKGNVTFKYKILLNDIEVFSNTDSYTVMEAGDSFNFVYPVPFDIYNYPATGKAKVVIDADNSIDEENEDNNEKEVAY